MQLPQFLRSPKQETDGSHSGVFVHAGLGEAPVVFYSGTNVAKHIILFTPGNPPLLGFYVPFLQSLYKELLGNVSILAHGHVRSTSAVAATLVSQTDALLRVVDACVAERYDRITIIGHSVGSWLAVQTLKERLSSVDRVFILFPTISKIADTPNGLKLSWAFKPPMPRLISILSFITHMIPLSCLALFFPSWPREQLLVLRTLLVSQSTIKYCLDLAHDEMNTIGDLGLHADFLHMSSDKIWAYFAVVDDWVGNQREVIVNALGRSNRVELCRLKMPHAFCLNHGELMAERCASWYLDAEGYSLG